MRRTTKIISLCIILSTLLFACAKDSERILSDPTISTVMIIAEPRGFQKGIVYTSWWNGEYSSPESDTTISDIIKPLGVNWVSVVVTCYQESIKATDIICQPESKTPTDEDLSHVIQVIHDNGLKVVLKPHIDISDNNIHWRGQIGFGNDEKAWRSWFSDYSNFINHYAKLAESNEVDYFVVGTELVQTSHRGSEWREVIRQVRTFYSGPVTYAANAGEVFDVSWWDELDAIGVDAYYPLSENNQPSVAELKKSWEPIINQLGQFSSRWNKPIIITEIGYQSKDGTNRMASNQESVSVVDLQEQADCYQALLESFNGHDWWHGIFWWNWSTDPNQGGPVDDDFTPHNKPAEGVLRSFYESH